jgi:hypothetical protein
MLEERGSAEIGSLVKRARRLWLNLCELISLEELAIDGTTSLPSRKRGRAPAPVGAR